MCCVRSLIVVVHRKATGQRNAKASYNTCAELPLRQRSAGSTRSLDTCTSAKSLNETIATWLYIACASLKLLRHLKQSSDCGESFLRMKFCTPCEYVVLSYRVRALMGKRGGWRWGRKRHDLPMDSFADAIKTSSLTCQ